jgi:transcriptional regulator with XRE-family HTH domain
LRPEPKTWGERIRRRRLELGLLQREAAETIGCSAASVTSWEGNRAHPKAIQVPGIICFLGYAPLEPAEPWPARLRRARQAVGLSRKSLAAKLGVDESTVARWEKGHGQLLGRLRNRLKAILGDEPR